MSEPEQPINKLGTTARRKRQPYLLISLGLLLGLSAAAWHVYGGNVFRAQTPLSATPGISDNPSSEPLTSDMIAAHTAPPADPKYIAIPAAGTDTRPVFRLGFLSSGSMATPDNIHKAGWFADSARPGQKGAVFIYGHASSWEAEGIFYNLKRLRPNDSITVTTGNDKTYTYKVIRSVVYPYDKVPMDTVLSQTDGRPGLNLMTCTGKLLPGSSDFSERLVVYASLAD